MLHRQLLNRLFATLSKVTENVIRRNEKIIAKEIIYIDQTGLKHGIRPLSQVLKEIDRKLYDLVEVNPTHSPPICKLVSKSSEFKRQQAIEDAAVRQRLKLREKEVRFGTSMAEHDYSIKLGRVSEMLEKAFRVKIVVEPKGVVNRSPAAKDQLWKRIYGDLVNVHGKNLTLVSTPQSEFRNLAAVVALVKAKLPSRVSENNDDGDDACSENE